MDSPKILVVDDTRIVLEATALTIELFGFTVDKANSAQAAISMFKTGHYAAILMDCNLPIVDGFECTRQIRSLEDQSGRRIPIIGFSASDELDVYQKCLNAGMDDFLPKDCSSQTLEDVMRQWTETPKKSPSSDVTREQRGKRSVLMFGQIEAINEFFEGQIDPSVEITLMESRKRQDSIYFSIGSDFYKCDRMSPTKWRVDNIDAP